MIGVARGVGIALPGRRARQAPRAARVPALAARRTHATAALLLVASVLTWILAAVGALVGVAPSPRALAMAGVGQVRALAPALALTLNNQAAYHDVQAKRRAEASFLDFVELMWPVLEPNQPFSRGKVQEAIAFHLEAISRGAIKNLLANVPPGSTKTYLVNVFWPAWEWGPRNRPDLRYMSWSYSADLTLEANDNCRKLIKSELYQRYWGHRFRLDEGSDAKGFYRNDKGGWRRSSSIKGQTTGFRADRLIWDDPHNVSDADSSAELTKATRWFARTLPTRVRNAGRGLAKVKTPYWVRRAHDPSLPGYEDPGFGHELETAPEDVDRPVTESATIGIMQRVHLHDISGIILRNPALGYEVLLIEMRYLGAEHPARKLPTFPTSRIGYGDWRSDLGELADPVRYDEEELTALEAKMISDGNGADAVAAQLQQWPLEAGGTLFRVEWLPIIEPEAVPFGVDKRGWDFAGSKAKKADQTATACVRRARADEGFFLMDSKAIRGGPKEVDDFIRQRHRDDPRTLDWSIPRDPGATGIHFATYVARELAAGRYVHDSPELGKVQSAKPVSSMAQRLLFTIVRHPGCEQTRAELIDFPYGDHDDLVDAISRAFALHFEHDTKGGSGGGGDALASDGVRATDSTPLGFDL